MGPRLHDLDRAGAGWAPRRRFVLGRAWQYLFLDRPGDRARRGYPDAAASFRRSESARAARKFREGALHWVGVILGPPLASPIEKGNRWNAVITARQAIPRISATITMASMPICGGSTSRPSSTSGTRRPTSTGRSRSTATAA